MTNGKKFGVWMDMQHATVVGKEDDKLVVVAHVTGEELPPNTSENAENNHKRTLQAKYFKEISSHLQNATHLHATGTGKAQEQFIHYLAETPQFKNTQTEESTANKMSDERLLVYFSERLL